MEKLGTSSFEFKGEFKRSKGPALKNWETSFNNSLKGLSEDERERRKREWNDEFSALRWDIEGRAKEMKEVHLYPDERTSFQDDEFFLTKAWGELVGLITEDLKEIIETADKELAEKKEKSRSEKDRKTYLERKNKILQEEIRKRMEILIPGFHNFSREKQLDLLDLIFEKIKEKSRFVRNKM